MIYTAAAIWQHPDIQMNIGGFILFALLVKGDYSEVRSLLLANFFFVYEAGDRVSSILESKQPMHFPAVDSGMNYWPSFIDVMMKIYDLPCPAGVLQLIQSSTRIHAGFCVKHTPL